MGLQALPGLCKHCNSTLTIERVKQFAQNGAIQVFDICTRCGRNVTEGGTFIKKERAGNVDTLRTLNDYRAGAPTCVYCGDNTQGVEWHHFAPKFLFGDDSECWPKAWLCKLCHKRWHDIVTPGMCDHE